MPYFKDYKITHVCFPVCAIGSVGFGWVREKRQEEVVAASGAYEGCLARAVSLAPSADPKKTACTFWQPRTLQGMKATISQVALVTLACL